MLSHLLNEQANCVLFSIHDYLSDDLVDITDDHMYTLLNDYRQNSGLIFVVLVIAASSYNNNILPG